MKKIVFILSTVFLLTGCSQNSVSESSTTEISTAAVTEMVTTVSDESTKTSTELTTVSTNVYAKQTYREVLEGVYYERKFPQWDGKDSDEFDVTQNEFLIYDIDSDGSDELILLYTNTYGAGQFGSVYDHDSQGHIVEEFRGFPHMRFYENGIIEVDASHNQGPSGRFWPYTMYQYNAATDTYEEVASVCALDQEIVDWQTEEAEEYGYDPVWVYPEDVDVSGTGLVYAIIPNGYDTEDAEYIGYVDVMVYNDWHDSYTNGAELLELSFLKLAEENISNVKS